MCDPKLCKDCHRSLSRACPEGERDEQEEKALPGALGPGGRTARPFPLGSALGATFPRPLDASRRPPRPAIAALGWCWRPLSVPACTAGSSALCSCHGARAAQQARRAGALRERLARSGLSVSSVPAVWRRGRARESPWNRGRRAAGRGLRGEDGRPHPEAVLPRAGEAAHQLHPAGSGEVIGAGHPLPRAHLSRQRGASARLGSARLGGEQGMGPRDFRFLRWPRGPQGQRLWRARRAQPPRMRAPEWPRRTSGFLSRHVF